MENLEQFPIYGCISGQIIELNENMLTYLKSHPEDKGFIAIVSSNYKQQ